MATNSSDPLVEPIPPGLTRSGAHRLDAIDMLRGLVIVIMVLDHVRDFLHIDAASFDPTDPLRASPILFFTRWITHLCAPTFVFLSGVSIFLQKANGKAPGDLTRFLLTRGAWLILLECTVISFGFNFGRPFLFLQVIWTIGMSMICMSVIARLPAVVVLALGAVIILLAPFSLPFAAVSTGTAKTLATLTVIPGVIAGVPSFVPYPFVPWLGVMCLGFGLGPIFCLEPARRTRTLFWVALVFLAGFAVLRTINGYGDPAPWSRQPTGLQTALSFLRVSKYPPSPDYVLATLGVSFLLFLALGRLRGPLARVLLDFGRTPLFTYVAHIYLAHGATLLLAIADGAPGRALDYLSKVFFSGAPSGWGYSLAVVYLVWALVIAALIPLARWFAAVKRRRRDWWLSYL